VEDFCDAAVAAILVVERDSSPQRQLGDFQASQHEFLLRGHGSRTFSFSKAPPGFSMGLQGQTESKALVFFID
jgi:hypothetical protein